MYRPLTNLGEKLLTYVDVLEETESFQVLWNTHSRRLGKHTHGLQPDLGLSVACEIPRYTRAGNYA